MNSTYWKYPWNDYAKINKGWRKKETHTKWVQNVRLLKQTVKPEIAQFVTGDVEFYVLLFTFWYSFAHISISAK